MRPGNIPARFRGRSAMRTAQRPVGPGGGDARRDVRRRSAGRRGRRRIRGAHESNAQARASDARTDCGCGHRKGAFAASTAKLGAARRSEGGIFSLLRGRYVRSGKIQGARTQKKRPGADARGRLRSAGIRYTSKSISRSSLVRDFQDSCPGMTASATPRFISWSFRIFSSTVF